MSLGVCGDGIAFQQVFDLIDAAARAVQFVAQ